MLTKQEVERTRSLVVRELDDYGDIAGLKKLSDQAMSAIDLAAENERLKAKAKHYVCIRERNRETIDDLKGKLNASESENERLKAELAEYAETFSEQNNALSDHIIKLDAVRTECEEWRQTGRPLSPMRLLAIIDKDGEDK
jgi:predicted nuclease with TOPRIM domain